MTDNKPLTNKELTWTGNYQDVDAFTALDVRSAFEGMRNTTYRTNIWDAEDEPCLNCGYRVMYVVSQGERRGWCRSCNEAYWFPVFAEEKK